jgi:hypothetical protein
VDLKETGFVVDWIQLAPVANDQPNDCQLLKTTLLQGLVSEVQSPLLLSCS